MKIFLFLLLLTYVLMNKSFAESTKKSLEGYINNPTKPGDVFCEPALPSEQVEHCYFVNNFSQTLDQISDTSGVMRAKTINKNQGDFIEVNIKELSSSIHPEFFTSHHTFEFYLKLLWKGHRPGIFKSELEGRHIIKGRFQRGPDGITNIEILSVPDLYLMHVLVPHPDLIDMFDRDLDQIYELEHDVILWMTLIISPVLNSYFNSKPSVKTILR